jgi:hypothetical protein
VKFVQAVQCSIPIRTPTFPVWGALSWRAPEAFPTDKFSPVP